jgi:DNA-binding CsgD family transcriptional regulator
MKGVLYNGLADYGRAAEVAHNAAYTNEIPMSAWALPELVEAAVRSGQTERAAEACERLSAMTAASGTAWARGTAALAQALIADGREGTAAEDLYQKAIELLGATPMRAYLARARLCYGEWLRSSNRVAEAGTQLRAAFEAFTAMGVKGFAERARRELEACGEKVGAPRRDPGADLTPQEHQIAQLARTRRTNAEIGALVFLSAATVEWHLRNIFVKLGIGSRRELEDALSSRDRQMAAATSHP